MDEAEDHWNGLKEQKCITNCHLTWIDDLEGEYLRNVKRWPIIHIRVMEEFIKKEIQGLQFFPIKLVDVITHDVNTNYVVMYIENFIDAFDMEKSKYIYNEKYDFYTFIPKETYLNKP